MTLRGLAPLVALLLLVSTSGPRIEASSRRVVTELELTTDGDHFEINGTEEFIVFVSYFDGLELDQSEWEDDFDYLESKGVRGIRVFPNWWTIFGDVYANDNYLKAFAQDTLIDHTGNLRAGRLTKLLNLLDTAKDYGLVVDLTFSAETVANCPSGTCYSPPGTATLTKSEFKSALEDLADALDSGSSYKHVMLDLQNEYNHVGPFGDSDIEDLRDAVKAVNPYLVVGASISSSISPTSAANKAEAANLDVANWHEFRNEDWYDSPTLKTQVSVDAMEAAAPSLPIYLSEPQRIRASESWLNRHGLAKSLYQAKSAGAAAWTFHNGGSMYLNTDRLEDELKAEDKAFLTCIPHALEDGDCTPGLPVALPSAPSQGLLELARSLFNGVRLAPDLRR